jgi:hypothetical protein
MAPLQYPKHRTKLCERWLILFSLDPRIQSTMSSRLAKVGLMLLLAAGSISIPLYRLTDAEPHHHLQLSADLQKLNAQLVQYKKVNGSYPKSLSAGPDHTPYTADDDWGD